MEKKLENVIYSLITSTQPVCCCKKFPMAQGNYSCQRSVVRNPNECPPLGQLGGPTTTCRVPCPAASTRVFCGYCTYCKQGSSVTIAGSTLRNCQTSAARAGGIFKSFTCCAPPPSSGIAC